MANITRFDPFGEMAKLDPFGDLGDWFKGFGLRPVLRGVEVEPQIKLDVSEDKGAYLVKAEVPGVKKEDIRVTIDGNRVSISAEMRREKDEKEGVQVVRSERYYGKMARTFTLDKEVEQSSAKAKVADGVLELVLPKKSGGTAKELPVS
jgi:HSP20 family protein